MADSSEFTANLPARTTASEAPIPFARPGNLAAIIGRIEEVVEEETAGIRSDTAYDLKASNARKSRYLYELTRAMRGGSDGSVSSCVGLRHTMILRRSGVGKPRPLTIHQSFRRMFATP